MSKTTPTLRDAWVMIRARQPFTMRDTLSGTVEWDGRFGHLPLDLREQVTEAAYVIYSYRTPIAWVDAAGVAHVPDVGYSPTTSQHQYLAADALDVDFRPAPGRTVVEIPKNDVAPWGAPRRLRRGGIDEL